VENLMSSIEMQERYKKKEDPFDITLEKWLRIRNFVDTDLSLNDFRELFQAASMAVPFCFEYQMNNCVGCPIEIICGRGRGERLLRMMRLLQAYVLAGDILPIGPLISEIDDLLLELETLKAKHNGLIH
jgi:hypothetical protein